MESQTDSATRTSFNGFIEHLSYRGDVERRIKSAITKQWTYVITIIINLLGVCVCVCEHAYPEVSEELFILKSSNAEPAP